MSADKAGMGMISIGAIVWGVRNLDREIAFWCSALHYELYRKDDDFAILNDPTGKGVQLSLKLITSDHAKRHHMDLFADDRDAEVKRLLDLGASLKPWNYEADADYTVLMDPDGNPFCVVQK